MAEIISLKVNRVRRADDVADALYAARRILMEAGYSGDIVEFATEEEIAELVANYG